MSEAALRIRLLGGLIQAWGDAPSREHTHIFELAIAHRQASAFGIDAYPDLVTKAAALLHLLVLNHPLVQIIIGSLRLGILEHHKGIGHKTDIPAGSGPVAIKPALMALPVWRMRTQPSRLRQTPVGRRASPRSSRRQMPSPRC